MSKTSRKKARQRKRKLKHLVLTCPACQAADDGSLRAIIQAIADTLNLAADNHIKVRLHHGIAEFRHGKVNGGFILPLSDGRWTPRDQHYDRLAPALSLDDDFE